MACVIHTHVDSSFCAIVEENKERDKLTMEETFYFGLLRVSICQILKANGFDKCKPSIVNFLTDIYIEYFTGLVEKARKFNDLRDGDDILSEQDLLQSMNEMGLLRLNGGKYNTKLIEGFRDWVLQSSNFSTSKKINKLPNNMVKTIIDIRKSREQQQQQQQRDPQFEQDEKLRKLKERQDYYNHFKQDQFDEVNQQSANGLDELEEEQLGIDWLTYLQEKDNKLGHQLKYLGTTLNSNENDGGDYIIDQESEINNFLPINLKYSEQLLSDEITE